MSAGFASTWPLSAAGEAQAMRLGSRPDVSVEAVRYSISPNYIETIGATLIAGRGVSLVEAQNTFNGPTRLVVINRSLARRLEPFGTVLGQTLSSSPALTYQIVGIIDDVAIDRPEGAEPTVLVAVPAGAPVLLFRVRPGTLSVTRRVLDALRPVWQEDAPVLVTSLETTLTETGSEGRAVSVLLAAIAGWCVALTGFGIATTVALALRQEERSLALRLAIGATVSQVRRLVLTSAIRPTLTGITFGLILGALAGEALRSVMWGVTPVDPSSSIAAGAGILAIAIGAALVPARRLARFDPAQLLRS